MKRFKRCVVMRNPKGTHYQRSQHFIYDLKQAFGDDYSSIDLTKDQYEDRDALAIQLKPLLGTDTLLCIAGGDGSVSFIINLLLLSPVLKAKQRETIILPLWGGNANDLAAMANGSGYRANIDHILSDGVIASFRPIAIETAKANKQALRLASNYVSFGISAYAMHHINHVPRHGKKRYKLPGSRMVIEAMIGLYALIKGDPIELKFDTSAQKLDELLLVNGSRIAKIYRAPVKITDDFFYEIRVHHRWPLLISYFGQILQRRLPAAIKRTSLRFTTLSKTYAQFDGEVQRIPIGTKISVQPHTESVRILSTRLSAN